MATTYYMRTAANGGSDSNNGLTPATAWLTLAKAIGASGVMVSGDQLFIGAGIYRLTAAQALTLAPTAETKLTGDPTGANTGDAGEVVITGYGTNDTTTPYTGTLFSFAAARNFYTWENITFEAPVGIMFPFFTGSHDWKFNDCLLIARRAGSDIFTYTSVAGTSMTLTCTRCYFQHTATAAVLTLTSTLHTADYNLAINFNTCYFHYKGGRPIVMTTTAGSGTGIPYGVNADSCYFDGTANAFQLTSLAHSIAGGSSISTWKHNIFDVGANAGINAGNTNQVVADYNCSLGMVAYTNTTAGAHDDATAAKSWRPDFGHLIKFGFAPRHWMTPSAGDPHLTFVASTETPPTTDILNRPVPSGGASANYQVGAIGRHDTFVQAASPVHGSAGHSWQITGPGDHQFDLPVDASALATTSVWVQYDANHGAGTKPQFALRNGGLIGVADQTLTLGAVGANTWGQLTFASYTPTAKGVVSIRFISSAAATGVVTFSDFAP